MGGEMGNAVDLSTILYEAPRNRWLALNEEQSAVVGVGRTIEETIEKAKKAGVQDPIIMWAPNTWVPSVY